MVLMSTQSPEAKTPGFLRNKKVLIAGGVVGGVVVFIAYRRSKATAAQTATTQDTSAADQYAQSGGDYGTAGFGNAGGSPYSALSYLTYDASTGQYYNPNHDASTANSTDWQSMTVTDNQTWAQKALAFLTGEGFNSGASSTALGKYLNGAELSDSETNIVSAALGQIGNTPVQVPPSYTNNTGFKPSQVAQYIQDSLTGDVYVVQSDPTKANGFQAAWLGRYAQGYTAPGGAPVLSGLINSYGVHASDVINNQALIDQYGGKG